MTPLLIAFAIVAVYKLFTLLTGLSFAYFGYRLFLADKTANAGDVEFKYGQYLLNVKGGAPGLFFSLFGVILIVFSIAKGVNYADDTTVQAAATNSPPDYVLHQH